MLELESEHKSEHKSQYDYDCCVLIWYNHKCSKSKFILGGKMETQRLSSNWLVCRDKIG